MSDSKPDRHDAEEPLPKLPRAPLFGRPSMASVVRIGMFGTLFYAIIVMRKPCADGVGRFVTSFEDTPAADAGSAGNEPQSYQGYELMTAEEALKRFPADDDTRVGDDAAAVDAALAPAVDAGATDQ